MSKNIKRDEHGHPILPGSQPFGELISSRGSSSGRTNDLKDRAAQRIWLLLQKGAQVDRLARKTEPIKDKQHLDSLAFQNNLATSPKIVQFAFHRSKLETLRGELESLLASDNRRKIEFSEPVIRKEIDEIEEIMRELFEEIKMERCVIKE